MSFLTQRIKQVHFWRISLLLAADGLVFGATNPNDTASFMLIVGFILLCATAYYLLDGLLTLTKLYGLPLRHKKRFLRAMTLLVSGLVAFQSLGQLSVRDVLVLSPLSVLLYLYIAYSKSSKRQVAAERARL
jgi:hypothetical protein